MRNSEEVLQLIMDVAINDERIRAVTMEGSRVSGNATHDQYCDFDISFVVNDIREFTKDNKWIEIFGEILIVQYPMDWYSHPYDYAGRDNFAYLIQFKDGNRIDLTLIDISNIEKEQNYCEPRLVLLNKDNLKEFKQVSDESVFKEYSDYNEQEVLSLYKSVGWVNYTQK